MTRRRSWLPTVIRARQAQEDLQAQQVARSRRELEQAGAELTEAGRRLDATQLPQSSTVADFHAGLAQQEAGLASLAAAGHRVRFADDRLARDLGALTEAARARRTVEKMSERIEQEIAVRELADDQRAQDEIALTRHVRAAG